MRKFSVRPTLTLKGRTFKGLRGWSGKPLHPPLTDFPIVAYVLAAVFDLLSAVAGKDHTWARELWHAGTYIFVGGAAVSVLAALTGLWDAWKSSEAGTQARRTINSHATIMVTVTVLALADIAWRLNVYHTAPVTPAPTIAVVNGSNEPMAGVAVTFTVTGGGGSVSPAIVLTDANGHASANWTLGAAPGVNTLSASAAYGGVAMQGGPIVFTATGTIFVP